MEESKNDTTETKVEEIADQAEAVAEDIKAKSKKIFDRYLPLLETITEKVRNFVLSFGELIVTVTVIIGLVTAVLDGITDMGNVGFFSGLATMFNGAVSAVMGALIIFLLFAIYKKER